MTLDEFFTELEKTPREWSYSDISRIPGSIRIFNGAKNKTYCPITYVAKLLTEMEYNISDFHDAGRMIGLSEKDIAMIANSADTKEYEKTTYRPRLLRACGLKEEL